MIPEPAVHVEFWEGNSIRRVKIVPPFSISSQDSPTMFFLTAAGTNGHGPYTIPMHCIRGWKEVVL